MDFLFKNLPVYLVFATMAAFAWLHGGARADALMPTLPWLWAFLFEALLCFPQRHPHEDPLSARRRVWERLRKDPLTYVTFAFIVLILIWAGGVWLGIRHSVTAHTNGVCVVKL